MTKEDLLRHRETLVGQSNQVAGAIQFCDVLLRQHFPDIAEESKPQTVDEDGNSV